MNERRIVRAALLRLAILAAAAAVALAGATCARAAERERNREATHVAIPDRPPPILEGVDVEERLGAQVPLDRSFTDADGRPVRLADLVGRGRPMVLVLAYYDCPMLCGLVLGGLARAMREMGLSLGSDYRAVTLSFDPREKPALAAERQGHYLQSLGRPEARADWAFLVGAEPQIRAVADAVGFRYRYDERTKQFAHAAAIFVLTPEGKVSRYLYGIEFPAKDLRLAVVEAGQGKVGTSFDRFLLTCYRYDSARRTYVPYALGFVRAGAVAVFAALVAMLGVFWRREWRARSR